MANIVTIGDVRYLVDVGYGADGPSRPLPLISGTSLRGLPGQEISLRYEKLPQHQDPGQRVWIYSTRRDPDTYKDVYHFMDTEFLPADFDILNYYNMSLSSFAQNVVVQRFILDKNDVAEAPCGVLLLLRDQLHLRTDLRQEIVEVFKTEKQRLAALEKYFHITLTKEQSEAIHGTPSELKDTL
jgi:arylamine N-acetyltransferase